MEEVDEARYEPVGTEGGDGPGQENGEKSLTVQCLNRKKRTENKDNVGSSCKANSCCNRLDFGFLSTRNEVYRHSPVCGVHVGLACACDGHEDVLLQLNALRPLTIFTTEKG